MLRTIIVLMVVLLSLMTIFGFASGQVSNISLAVALAWNVFLLPFAVFLNRMSDLACRVGLHVALVGGLARWCFGWLASPTEDIFPATITGLLLPPILLFAISFFETPRRSAWTGYCCAAVMGTTLVLGSQREALDVLGFSDWRLGLVVTAIIGLHSHFLAVWANQRAKFAGVEAVSKAKGEFLANISHEIRTPMNAIIGLSEIALRSDLSARQRDHVKKINSSANNLLQIINDLLDISKVEAGKMTVELMPLNLEQLLDELATVVAADVEAKGLELLFDVDPNLPKSLLGDPLRLNQILLNLTGNARKFTDSGHIIIGVKKRPSPDASGDICRVQFSVTDTGIGMDQEQAARLFQAFVQAEVGTTRKYGGTGLGLAISRQLVELMGGNIWVDSELGGGSRFCFEIPFEIDSEHPEETLGPQKDPSLQGMRVLVVDDNADARAIFAKTLDNFGLQVTQASSGHEAVRLCAEGVTDGGYHLVLMDYQMPTLDGLATAEQMVDALPADQHPAIILLAAAGHTREVESDPRYRHIAGWVCQPINPSVLFDAIVATLLGDGPVTRMLQGAAEDVDRSELDPIRGAAILLVEDNKINQEVALEFLADGDFAIEIAEDGVEAVEWVARQSFDCVLMDVHMPNMDGLEATRRIRAQAKHPDLPILAMTANMMPEDIEAAITAGMNAHISKPISVAELNQTLLRWIPHKYYPGARRAEVDTAPVRTLLPAQLSGCDLERALAALAGRQQVLQRMLTSLVADHSEDLDLIHGSLAVDATEQAHRTAHTLRSLLAAIGALDLGDRVAELERTLKGNDHERALDILVELKPPYQQLMAELTDWQAGLGEASLTVGSQPISSDPGAVKSLVDRLTVAIESYDPSVVDLAKALAQQLGADHPQAQPIVAMAEAYEFDRVAEQLNILRTRGKS